MISRYTRPELAALWNESRRLALFLEVELAATAALEEAPSSPIPTITDRAKRTKLSTPVGVACPTVSHRHSLCAPESMAFLNSGASISGRDRMVSSVT